MSNSLKKIINILMIALLCSTFGCKHPTGTARLRIAQLLVDDDPMIIQLFKDGKEVYAEQITYGSLSSYENVSAGTLTLRVTTGQKVLLEKKVGLGNKGVYTLCLYGLPVKNEGKNSSTLANTLHNLAEGEEAHNPNGLLPKFKIMNDIFYGDSSKAKVRWVHAVPGMQHLEGHLISTDPIDTLSIKKIDYPQESALMEVKPGKISVYWNLATKNRKVAQQKTILKTGTITTFFIFPQRKNYIDSLRVLMAGKEDWKIH